MGYIKQLPEDLIKKISAGEVIERPASVVKELIENSIDANATKIEIEIKRAGKYIKVSDNGNGIEPDDVPLLFSRHATSKLNDFNELWEINTLGFRGEALASISSVSKIICRSKHKNQECGFEITFAHGEVNKKSSSISIGTVFEIDDLFYNVPARQKFLKSETTEVNHIYDVVISEALSHSEISFSLLNNDTVLLKSSGSNDLKQVAIELLGTDLKDRLISLSTKNNFLDLNGYVSALEIFRSDRKSIFIFINKRPVKCQIISKAITSAFEGLLPGGKYPIVVLNLTFKPGFVDVNVHPTKKEVRYMQPNDVYNLVLHSIQNAVSEYYKKEYKKKAVYTLEEVAMPKEFTEAAFDFYRPQEERLETRDQRPETDELQPSKEQFEGLASMVRSLLNISNLKCNLIYSDKPIANMSKIGSKTIFEVGSIFNDNLQIVFSGEIIGEETYQKSFFNSLSDISEEIYKTVSSKEEIIQKKLINPDLEEDEQKEIQRKKPPKSLLYKIWERDNWTCVYCGKQLLDPEVVKEAIPKAKDAFVSYINNNGEKVTVHILQEHSASYDHYLPVSKLPQFNFEEENLFACCIACNRKKLNSMELNAWKPNRQNGWDKPLEIASLCFNTPGSIILPV
ncbi:MAG: DNA mismatch repair endonuclease MutL [Candidatus Melainabacteria bacterium]|nr:DNA mismatch repair endonuclease MutL [Candidatus Melainabacteria bacterium]